MRTPERKLGTLEPGDLFSFTPDGQVWRVEKKLTHTVRAVAETWSPIAKEPKPADFKASAIVLYLERRSRRNRYGAV